MSACTTDGFVPLFPEDLDIDIIHHVFSHKDSVFEMVGMTRDGRTGVWLTFNKTRIPTMIVFPLDPARFALQTLGDVQGRACDINGNGRGEILFLNSMHTGWNLIAMERTPEGSSVSIHELSSDLLMNEDWKGLFRWGPESVECVDMSGRGIDDLFVMARGRTFYRIRNGSE